MTPVALVGSTASGKSSLALQLARETGAAILSCDSLLVYKDLNIGTAKPTEDERRKITHHGIDLVPLDHPFTAGDYVRYAQPIIVDAVANKRPLLIVGGTGFYLKALLCGVWDAPPTHPEIRAKLEAEVASLPVEERARALHDKLARLDPTYAAKVMVNDTYRVIRGLEIIEITGRPVSQRLTETKLQSPLPFDVPVFGLTRAKVDLERRIAERMNTMFAQGLVTETRALLERFGDAKPPRPFFCVGYTEVMQHLAGTLTLPEARERIVIATRQLAKKQMTFFKGQFPKPIEWHQMPAGEEELLAKVRSLLGR